MKLALSSRQYSKNTTKQPEFYIYRDSGYLVSFGAVGDYKSVYICAQQT